MNPEIVKFFQQSESLADHGRFMPAIEALQNVRNMQAPPELKAFASYNIGVIYFQMLGHGEAARTEFLQAIERFEQHGYGRNLQVNVIHANALENAMLCSLSFDEFENLAARLESLTPGVPIIVELVPEIKKRRAEGQPWRNQLFGFAYSCYNRNDPALDIGRYGQAKATYSLLLANRGMLRLSREDWRLAVFEATVLSMRMVSDCIKLRGGDSDAHSPEEFLPMITDVLPVLDNYLASNSGDEDLVKFRSDMEGIIDNCRKRWDSRYYAPNYLTTDFSPNTQFQVCQKCGTVYARRDIQGENMMPFTRVLYDQSKMCMRCGGEVIWQTGTQPEARFQPGCLFVWLLMVALPAALLIL